MGLKDRLISWFRTPKDYTDEPAYYRNDKSSGEVCLECARYRNGALQKAGYNIFGDAWTLLANKKLAKVYSGYNTKNRPKTYDDDKVKDYVYSAADSIQSTIDLKALKDNDIVGLYYRRSPNWQKAWEEGVGGEALTHTGYIRVEEGTPYVYHNVHGDLIKNKVEDVLGQNRPWGIVSVYRPKKLNGGSINYLTLFDHD